MVGMMNINNAKTTSNWHSLEDRAIAPQEPTDQLVSKPEWHVMQGIRLDRRGDGTAVEKRKSFV
jgi:hypothetical protein